MSKLARSAEEAAARSIAEEAAACMGDGGTVSDVVQYDHMLIRDTYQEFVRVGILAEIYSTSEVGHRICNRASELLMTASVSITLEGN